MALTPPPITCNVHSFLVDGNYQLPYKYDSYELAKSSNVKPGDYIIYTFDIQNQSGIEQIDLLKADMTQVSGVNEGIDIIQVKPQNGECTIDSSNKKVSCNLRYFFTESTYSPIEYLIKIRDDAKNSTSSMFSLETSGGSTQCVSMFWVKNPGLPTSAPTVSCKNLWWFDNTNKVCSQKQFCGAYMYQGLRTFATEAECKKNLLPTNCAYKKCGDANCDGLIDSKDLIVWMRERNSNDKTGDFNGDGKVDVKDYEILKNGIINKCGEIIVNKKCNLDSDCGVNQKCYQPPMPECKAGMACIQVMPAKYCVVNVVTSTPTISCNMSTNPPKTCPLGYRCLTRSDMAGSGGVCIKMETTTKPTSTSKCNTNGDADRDGKVTLKDYAWWKFEFHRGKVGSGDFDCNNKVDMVDYQIWKEAFLASRKLEVTIKN